MDRKSKASVLADAKQLVELFGQVSHPDRAEKVTMVLADELRLLEESNTAMVRQLKDQDVRMEKQHRDWNEETLEQQERIDTLEGMCSRQGTTIDEQQKRITELEEELESNATTNQGAHR